MKTNVELFEMAVQAGYNYKKVFGIFPDRIGVERERLKSFEAESINYPEDTTPFDIPRDTDAVEWTYLPFHRAYFTAVSGYSISPDEVYLPGRQEVMFGGFSSTQIARMADTKKAQEDAIIGLQIVEMKKCREVKA